MCSFTATLENDTPGPISLIKQIGCLHLSHNYKVEIQNKQIQTFQVVLLTRSAVGGAGSVCVCGGGGRRGYLFP